MKRINIFYLADLLSPLRDELGIFYFALAITVIYFNFIIIRQYCNFFMVTTNPLYRLRAIKYTVVYSLKPILVSMFDRKSRSPYSSTCGGSKLVYARIFKI